MKTKEIQLFKFEELSVEVQAKLVEKNGDINVYDDWHSDSLEDFKTELAEEGFTDATISYSGFWSQGDGLSFDATIDIDKFAETSSEKRIAKLINNGDLDNYTICRNSYANHYSHSRTRYVDKPYFHSNKHINLEAIVDALEEKINNKRLELCEKYYRALEKEYDGLQTEESIIETLIDNDNDYLINGTVFND